MFLRRVQEAKEMRYQAPTLDQMTVITCAPTGPNNMNPRGGGAPERVAVRGESQRP